MVNRKKKKSGERVLANEEKMCVPVHPWSSVFLFNKFNETSQSGHKKMAIQYHAMPHHTIAVAVAVAIDWHSKPIHMSMSVYFVYTKCKMHKCTSARENVFE